MGDIRDSKLIAGQMANRTAWHYCYGHVIERLCSFLMLHTLLITLIPTLDTRSGQPDTHSLHRHLFHRYMYVLRNSIPPIGLAGTKWLRLDATSLGPILQTGRIDGLGPRPWTQLSPTIRAVSGRVSTPPLIQLFAGAVSTLLAT